MANNGSVQTIKDIPDEIKKVYKTVWEIPQKIIINLAVSRAIYIDQSQSLNIHLSDPSFSKISTMHFYAWKTGLKTGMYYLRTKPAVDAIKFTLNMEELLKATEKNNTEEVIKCLDLKIEEVKDDGKKIVVVNKELSEKEIKDLQQDEGCIGCSG
jgi:ribonucleoside-diphosphate reductase subunit M1